MRGETQIDYTAIENDTDYRKLHKKLTTDNKNKDIRNHIQSKLDEKPENHLHLVQNPLLFSERDFIFRLAFDFDS